MNLTKPHITPPHAISSPLGYRSHRRYRLLEYHPLAELQSWQCHSAYVGVRFGRALDFRDYGASKALA